MTTTKPSLVDSLATFASLVEERGPTVREFQEALGLSSTSVADYRLKLMMEQGWVERARGRNAGGWRLTEAGREALGERT